MTKDKISIQEIIDLVAKKAAISKRAAEEFLKVLISTIEETLQGGESVKIKDFGTFKLQWNGARKSVNINTGEDIFLSGYYKISFTPDITLKELVNEPFAHLEAVNLDDNKVEHNEQIHKNETEINPLRIFEEQATEIKSIISEIQALSTNLKPSSTAAESANLLENSTETELENDNGLLNTTPEIVDIEKNAIDTDYIDKYEEVSPVGSADLAIDKEIEEEEKTVEEEIISEKISEIKDEPVPIAKTDMDTNPFIEGASTVKKIRKVLWITIIIVVLSVGSISSYLYFPPFTNLIHKGLDKVEYLALSFKDSASTTDLLNTLAKWFTPTSNVEVKPETVIIPKAAVEGDSINEADTVDSLQLLFDTPRIYPEYIATEKIISGSRLARMSERYYGKSDFWVYIYEANQNRIPNPDNIPSGTLIYIPKVDPRLIDSTNPRCLKKARELHELYVKTDEMR